MLAFLFSTASVTSIFGPTIGAFLYKKFVPGLPALAPSLVGFCVAVLAWLTVYFYCPETRPASARASSSSAVTEADDSWGVLLSPRLRLLISLKGVTSLLTMGLAEAIPILAVAELRLGGLGLHQEELGVLLAGVGALQWGYTSFLMAPASARFPLATTLVLFHLLFAAGCLLFPLVHTLLMSHPTSLFPTAGAIVFLINGSAYSIMTSATAGMNNVIARHYAAHAGALNGRIALTDAVLKSLGPFLLPPLFAVGLTSRPLGGVLGAPSDGVPVVWMSFALLGLWLAAASRAVTDADDSDRREAADEDEEERQRGASAMLRWSGLLRLRMYAQRLRGYSLARDAERELDFEDSAHRCAMGLPSGRHEAE